MLLLSNLILKGCQCTVHGKPLVCRCTVHGKPYIYFNPCAYHFAHVVCYSNNTSITKCIQLLSNHFNEHQNSRN